MIDFHTHTILSDGELLPSELVRRAHVLGYKAIGLTDHVDFSNLDFIAPRIVKIAKRLNRFWKIRVIPGVELTHMPLQEFAPAIKFARGKGIKLIIIHGETTVEPVIPQTNTHALSLDIDILAHPGKITEAQACKAKAKNIYLELTSRRGHRLSNAHVARIAKKVNAPLVFNSDTHAPGDLLTLSKAKRILKNCGIKKDYIEEILGNSKGLLRRVLNR